MTAPCEDEAALGPQVKQKALSPWFVPIMETIGYALCGLVGIGLLYSLVTEVDVLVPCEGSLMASAESAVAPTESIVVDWFAQPGQEVNAGDPLCALAVEPLSRDKARARHLLNAACRDLATLTDAQSQSAAAQARAALDTLGNPQGLQILDAPESGVISPTGPALRAELLKPGEPVAHIVDVSRLVMVGKVPVSESAKVAVGNLAKVTAPPSGAVLEGRVVDVNKDTPETVTLRFESIPESLRQTYLANFIISETDTTEISTCKAEIVLGRTSLFRSLFGRR